MHWRPWCFCLCQRSFPFSKINWQIPICPITLFFISVPSALFPPKRFYSSSQFASQGPVIGSHLQASVSSKLALLPLPSYDFRIEASTPVAWLRVEGHPPGPAIHIQGPCMPGQPLIGLLLTPATPPSWQPSTTAGGSSDTHNPFPSTTLQYALLNLQPFPISS